MVYFGCEVRKNEDIWFKGYLVDRRWKIRLLDLVINGFLESCLKFKVLWVLSMILLKKEKDYIIFFF